MIYLDKLESDDLSDVPANKLDQATSSESDPNCSGLRLRRFSTFLCLHSLSSCPNHRHCPFFSSLDDLHSTPGRLGFQHRYRPLLVTASWAHETSAFYFGGSRLMLLVSFENQQTVAIQHWQNNCARLPHLPQTQPIGEQFESKEGFEMAELLYNKAHMSEGDIRSNGSVPFSDHTNLYVAIDGLAVGDVPWQSFTWMSDVHKVFYRDPHLIVRGMLTNPDYEGSMDFGPYHAFDKDGTRVYEHMMSGDWAWEQATKIARDPRMHGSAFVPIILGSDKTTVSVAMGQTDYYPLYLSIGNLHNNIRRSHRGGVALAGFLAIAQTEKKHSNSPGFQRFCRQLFHTSLARILSSLCPGMSEPEVVRCADGCTAPKDELETLGHPRSSEHTDAIQELLGLGELWNIYGIVGDVKPFTNDFPRACVYELLSPDLLHQLIKGTFKDHLVQWVTAILDDINRRIAAAPLFAGLRRFHEGWGFKQWTGDDSKALMKVYLPAIEGHVPNKMLYAIRSFLDFCYIAHHNVITEITLTELEGALAQFNKYRTVFQEEGVREDFSLPRQHSMHHYPDMIRFFGAPNSLCSSIMEAKHIKAVKEPWHRSNRNKPLKQMLLTNQRLDKLMAAQIDFTRRGMLDRSQLNASLKKMERVQEAFNKQRAGKGAEDLSDIVNDSTILAHVELAKTTYHRGTVTSIATYFKKPTFPTLVQRFLHYQLSSGSRFDEDTSNSETLGVSLFNSASSIFLAPSDPCGIHGLRREQIRSTRSWRGGPLRYDVVLVNMGDGGNKALPMSGYAATRVLFFFSLKHSGENFPAALVWWYTLSDSSGHRDEVTGMWLVKREYNRDQKPHLAVVHIHTIFRTVHLLPYFGQELVQKGFSYTNTLDSYAIFYVNKYTDHHSFKIL
ncbi:hypothetical protein EDB86DRAFT_3061736 [Lactarius hatsudake]|nr:hypothetical protein EDB86DRAFT_3061736 [Lactarius hatsudake]